MRGGDQEWWEKKGAYERKMARRRYLLERGAELLPWMIIGLLVAGLLKECL